MTIWQELVKTAVLGTQRAELPTIAPNSELTTLLAQLQGGEPEAVLLNMAGVITLHGQAGWLPQRVTQERTQSADGFLHPTIEVHEDSQKERREKLWCGVKIERRLQTLLDGGYAGILEEYLIAFHNVGLTLPPSMLPSYLAKGANLARTRPFILPTLGEKGRRLAAKNPKWEYAMLGECNLQQTIAQWTDADAAKRSKLLQQLRQTHPDKARQLLQSRWAQEADALRPRLVKLLIHNLSMADEPFLEKALDDRNFLVRQKAAHMLTHLPDSRLSKRMNGYAKAMLSWTPQNEQKISINILDEISPKMGRDGILRRSGMDAARLRTRRLTQLLTAVSLSHWTTSWDVTPTEILNAIPSTRWQRTLTNGFIIATHRQKNQAWAKAILQQGVGDQNARLVSNLSLVDYREIVANLSKQFTAFPLLKKGAPLRRLLHRWEYGWDEEMARYWLQAIAHHMKNESDNKKTDPSFSTISKRFAQKCPYGMRETAVSLLNPTQLTPYWRNIAHDIINTMTFREDMIAELKGTI